MKVCWIPVAFPQRTLILLGSEEHQFWLNYEGELNTCSISSKNTILIRLGGVLNTWSISPKNTDFVGFRRTPILTELWRWVEYLQHFLKERYFDTVRGCFEYLKHFTIEHWYSWGYKGVLTTWSISSSLLTLLSPSADTSPPSAVPSALDSLFTTPQFTQDSLRGDWHVAQTPRTEEAPVTLS